MTPRRTAPTQPRIALRDWPLLVQVTMFPVSARLARDVPLSTCRVPALSVTQRVCMKLAGRLSG